jgi:hypothetical protein
MSTACVPEYRRNIVHAHHKTDPGTVIVDEPIGGGRR